MNDDNNLDLLDLDDDGAVDTLPDVPPFVTPRPKKPWLLLSIGVAVIVLATYIIVQAIGDDDSAVIEVDLDAPVEFVSDELVPDMNVMPPAKVVEVKPVEKTQPKKVEEVKVVQEENIGVPVRVIEERKEVKFNPEKKSEVKPKKVEKKQNIVVRANENKQVRKAQSKPAAARKSVSSWYVQFGSYSTRALAESAQRKIANQHKSLFADKQFVILAAQLKNGSTTYRLRVGFTNAKDANGFCRNAKSDGLDCYVAK